MSVARDKNMPSAGAPSPRWFEAILLATGAVFLGLLFWRFGWRTGSDWVLRLGWWLPVFLSLEAASKAFSASALRLLVPGRRLGWRAAWTLTLAADAANYFVPSASIVGYALQHRFIGRGVSSSQSLATVAAAGALQTAAQFVFAACGACLLLALTPSSPLRNWSVAAVFAVSSIILALAAGALWHGLFGSLLSFLRRLRLPLLKSWSEVGEADSVDVELARMRRERPLDMAGAFLLYGAGWAWSAVEIAVAFQLLGQPFHWWQVAAVEAVSVFVDGVIFFIPAKAGSQEGGKVLAFSLVGLSAEAGLSFGVLRRVREMTWAAFGWWELLSFWRSR